LSLRPSKIKAFGPFIFFAPDDFNPNLTLNIYLARNCSTLPIFFSSFLASAFLSSSFTAKLIIDWEVAVSVEGATTNHCSLIASTSKNDNHLVFDARLLTQSSLSRRIDVLDVSNLIGNYYIRVAARATVLAAAASMKVYRILGVAR